MEVLTLVVPSARLENKMGTHSPDAWAPGALEIILHLCMFVELHKNCKACLQSLSRTLGNKVGFIVDYSINQGLNGISELRQASSIL